VATGDARTGGRPASARREERREEIRRLYVALTRAAHQTVVWFGPLGSKGLDPGASALGRMLLRGATADPQQVTYPQFPAAKSDAAGSASAAACRRSSAG
jgi:ATP-dependent exoDNAse (exonuclease V) beta subunit